jgi:hypothetical protein
MIPPDSSWFEQVEKQIGQLQTDFGLLKDDLLENTRTTKKVEANTAGVVEAFQAAAGAFKVLETIGKLAKPLLWIGTIATAVATFWNSWKASITALFR